MQTGDSQEQSQRKRRSDRYYTEPPVQAPSDESTGIPVPKAMQKAQQTGSQRPVAPDTQSMRTRPVRTPAASYDPTKPRRQPEDLEEQTPEMIRVRQILKKAEQQPHVSGYRQLAEAEAKQRQTGQQPVPPEGWAPYPQPPVQGFAQGQQPYPSQPPVQGFAQGQQPYPPQLPVQGFAQGQQPYPPKPPQTIWQTGQIGARPAKASAGGQQLSIKALLIALGAVAAILLVTFGVIQMTVIGPQKAEQEQRTAWVQSYNDRFCEGVYVDGVHLGNMTQQEALTAVRAKAEAGHSTWSVRLMYQGQVYTVIDSSTISMTVNVNDALNTAWRAGHESTDEEVRYASMMALKDTPLEVYSAKPSTDTTQVDQILTTLRQSIYRAPQDAALVEFNPELSDPFVFSTEVTGRILDTAPIRAEILHMLETGTSGDIEIVPTYIQPSVTVGDLRKLTTKRGTAYTEIGTSSTEDRNNNIRRALDLCTGTVLRPGETFSFNGKVGERSEANGFFHAPEYVYDELTDGVGGGVCQASTTIMQAALKAGLTVTDHTPHSEKANYSEFGQDATVYWMYNRRIDMKFKNNTESNIYIVCSVQSNPNNRKRLIAKCDIYGIDLGNVSYDIVSNLVEEIPYETVRERDKQHQYVSYSDEEVVVTNGRIGYVYDTYRITKVNGVEAAREFMFQSTYKKRDEKIMVGTLERPVQ